MKSSVHIENDFPTAFRCIGNRYRETSDVPMNDLLIYIDLSLHTFLREIPVLNPTYELSLMRKQGIFDVRVAIEIECANAAIPLRPRIENLLWAFNQQVFTQRNGKAVAHPPRFEFHIEIKGRDTRETVIEIEESEVAQ